MIKTRLIKLLSHAKKYVYLNVVWQWLSLLAQIIAVFQIAELVELLAVGELMPAQIVEAFLTIGAVILVKVLCEKMQEHASFMASTDVKRILREKIYEKMLKLGPSYSEKVSTAEILQLSSEGVEQLETYFGKYLSQFFYALLAPLTLFAVMSLTVSVKVSVILLIFVPLIPLSIVVVMKIAKRLLNKYWSLYAELGDSFLENLQGMTTLKIYQADGAKAEEMDKEADHFRRVTMKVLTMQLNSTSVMDIMAYGGAAVGMVTALSLFLAGTITIAETLMVILLSAEFFLPMRVLGSYFHIAMNGMAASDKIFRLLDLPEEEGGEEELEAKAYPIAMENVHFAYEKNNEILKGIDLMIPSGARVGLVGVSGCGKSTAAGILAGRNKGYEGSIRIGDTQLREVSERSLLQTIAMVGSKAHLFKGTVRENLLEAKPDASDEELWTVLEKVQLKDFLSEQEGLDTELLENAGNLSGGQAQRLALARALLYDAPVMIFDEATSNIDAESEEAIMDVIRSLEGKKTVLLISHRLYNVADADRIVLLEDGKVKEAGTQDELMKRRGAYAKLYLKQRELEEYAAKPTSAARRLTLEHEVKVTAEEKRKAYLAQFSRRQEDDPGEENEPSGTSRRSGLAIMRRLIKLVKPLSGVMILAVVLGVIGFGCAIFLSILGTQVLQNHLRVSALAGVTLMFKDGFMGSMAASVLMGTMIAIAVLRGVFHYAEQYCNHFIAFKLLALIRHKVFAALRKLCPAKLEGRDKGDLISLLTTDIELLEVFYAHTISPIAIAVLVSLLMVIFIGHYHYLMGLTALCGYLVIGVVIPLVNGKLTKDKGMHFREAFASLTAFVLDALRGLDESIQFGSGEKRKEMISDKSVELAAMQKELSDKAGTQRAVTSAMVLLFSAIMLLVSLYLYGTGAVGIEAVLTGTIAMMSSCGPVVALSGLSNNLNQTLASGERVLRILEEDPKVEEVEGEGKLKFEGAALENVSFTYEKEKILDHDSLTIEKGTILGIHGKSGSGKSTILKLLMRFWDVDGGEVVISGKNIKTIPTASLRGAEAYVTQETEMFTGTIADNIRIGRLDASQKEIETAAAKASIAEWIESLPDGYETKVGELGDTLSSGEKQRIGLARAFLHKAPLMLLDEPTSNLDSLNEAVILKALKESMPDKTVVLVSHRASTMNIADTIVQMDESRVS